MTKKDKTILDQHEGATPHDLLTLHGLSEAGFNELVAKADIDAQNALKATPPKLTPQNILKPVIQPIGAPSQGSGNVSSKVRIKPAAGGGLGTVLSRDIAESMVRKAPGKYKIYEE